MWLWLKSINMMCQLFLTAIAVGVLAVLLLALLLGVFLWLRFKKQQRNSQNAQKIQSRTNRFVYY